MTTIETSAISAPDAARRFRADERGATAIEYAMIAAGVGVAIVGAVIERSARTLKTTFYDKLAAAALKLASAARLLAGGDFRGAERVGEPRLGRARLQRLLLALMRRPARQPDDLEGRAHAAVGIGEALGIDFRPSAAASRAAAALRRRSVSTLVAPMRRRSCISASGDGIAHRDAVDVGDRQREARALQQRAEIAQVGERRDARRDAAFDFALGLREGLRAARSGCRRRSAPRETGRPASARGGSGSARPAGR